MAGVQAVHCDWVQAWGVGWQRWIMVCLVWCFCVSIVVSGICYSAQSLRCLLPGWCVLGSLCIFAPRCESLLTCSCCLAVYTPADTANCITHCTIQCNKFSCVLTATCTYCIYSIEHNGDVAPKSYGTCDVRVTSTCIILYRVS